MVHSSPVGLQKSYSELFSPKPRRSVCGSEMENPGADGEVHSCLARSLTGSLARSQLARSLTGVSTGSLAGSLTDRFADWLIVWLADWLADWLTG